MKLAADHPAPPVATNASGILGPAHPHTLNSLRELVHLYESRNKPDEAAKWRTRLPAGSGTGP